MAEGLKIAGTSGLTQAGSHLSHRAEPARLRRSRSTVTACSRFCPKATDFFAARTGATSPAPTTSTSRPRRSSDSTCCTGDTVRGQVRPPKAWERYLALLKVEARQRRSSPRSRSSASPFDNLRPRYPDDRLRLERKNGDLSMRVDGPHRADRKGTARTHRRAAARRQDDSAAEDGECDRGESSGGHAHHPADRRAAGGSHRIREQRSTREVISSTFDETADASRAGRRHGDREGEATGRDTARTS